MAEETAKKKVIAVGTGGRASNKNSLQKAIRETLHKEPHLSIDNLHEASKKQVKHSAQHLIDGDVTFRLKKGTHVVFKEDDIKKHLSKEESDILAILYEKVIRGRNSLGKKENQYYIVNLDEPYSNAVFQVIRNGEVLKNIIRKDKEHNENV